MLLPVLTNVTQLSNILPPTSLVTSTPSTCNDLNNCRTNADIVWSCLATIFVCVWVGVHSNVPKPKPREKQKPLGWWKERKVELKNWWSPVRDRLVHSVWALLAPEFILVWAIRQRFVAGSIARECKRIMWKRTRRGQLWQWEQVEEQKWEHQHRSNASERAREEARKRAKERAREQAMDQVIEREEARERVWVWVRRCLTRASKSPQNGLGLTDVGQDHTIGPGNEVPGPIDNIEWTTTHGFFILMGGFHFCNGDVPLHPLDRKEVVERIQGGTLTYLPSEDEIKDKSKGDALSKAIFIGQTVWFVAQCIARGIQDITITELEVVTLAYTLVIVLMYGFWWNKPLSVDQPVRVQSKDGEGAPPSVDPLSWAKTFEKWFYVFGGGYDESSEIYKEMKIPTFYAGELDASEIFLADLIASIVAIFFGATHCIAWTYKYPSHAELLLWRISSIAVVGGPGIWALIFLLLFLDAKDKIDIDRWGWELVDVALYILGSIAIIIYIIARIILLTLAFTSLRSLPPAAYQTVTWTTFIPHI